MKNQKGQTIIEAVIALTTIMLILSAISIVVVSSIYNSQFIRNQNLANKYSQQGMEFVRNMQQNDIQQFASYDLITTCIDENTSTLTTENCTSVNVGGTHVRTIQLNKDVSPCRDGETRVTVTSKWSSSKCPSSNSFCHSSILSSCFPYAGNATP